MADGQTELIPADTSEVAVQGGSLPAQRMDYDLEALTFAQRVALDPSVDIERLSKIIEMENASQDREARKVFEAAFAKMQPDLPAVAKIGEGHQSAKYARLEDIQAAVRPALKEHGFSTRFKVADHETGMSITCILSHACGHSDSDTILLPYETSGSKNNVQARGSTVAYGKRYTLCNILGIQTGGEDTDGGKPLSGEALTGEQVAEIRARLKELDRKEEVFLQFMASKGVTVASELSAVPIESFETMKLTLDGMVKKKAATNDK